MVLTMDGNNFDAADIVDALDADESLDLTTDEQSWWGGVFETGPLQGS